MNDTGQYMGDKMRADTLNKGIASGLVGQGPALDRGYKQRESLFGALESRVHRAEEASRDKGRLERLLQLAQKHEEIFEMISLVRDLGLL